MIAASRLAGRGRSNAGAVRKFTLRGFSCKAFLPAQSAREYNRSMKIDVRHCVQGGITIRQRRWPCAGEFLRWEADPCWPAYYPLNVESCWLPVLRM
jgi:hypothetical protein